MISTREQFIYDWLSTKAAEGIKTLLEQKHLYQKVDIDPKEVIQGYVKQMTEPHHRNDFKLWTTTHLASERFTIDIAQMQLLNIGGKSTGTSHIRVTLPHPSLYCKTKTCDRRETFTPVWFTEVSNELHGATIGLGFKKVVPPTGWQMFLLVYQCQRCLGPPEGFLVRRDGWTLSLHGRSPMEQVELPKFIPEKESSYYRDAVIAFQSGKTLAALFYLRTFVEQFARRVTGMTGRATGEEILDSYYKTLPSPMKDQMPSLREWYESISVPIHEGKDDLDVFNAAKEAIDKHFEIRKVFKMSEDLPAKDSQTATDGENKEEPDN